MPFDSDSQRYKWLRVLLGACITIAVVIGLITVVLRYLTTWSPPAIVAIPPSPPVEVELLEHPRLVSSIDAIEILTGNPESSEFKLLMSKAEEFYEEYLIDPLQGDTVYPGYFALAWRISGDEKYLDAAKDMILNECRFPRWQRHSESANFYKIELAYTVGLCYDLVYDSLSPSEKAVIEDRLSEVLDGLIWHIRGNPRKPFWFEAPHSNYYVAHHSAVGILALCLGDVYPRWESAVAFAYDGLEPSIELLESDGGWIEGLTYLDFCWGQHAFLFLNALRVNNGPNRLQEDWYKTSVKFALAGILPSGTEQVNFGDNINDPRGAFSYIWRAKPFFDSSFLDSYLEQYMPDPDYPRIILDAILVNCMLEFDPDLPLGEFEEPQPCQYFPGIEWTMLRGDWTDPDGFFLAAKAGYGGWDHNHIDQGTFILAFGEEIYISDPGRGDFEERKNPEVNRFYGGPFGHNVLIPEQDDDLWDEFTMYSENAEHRQEDAAIENWSDSPAHTSFKMNLNGAYPAYGELNWQRHFVWWKPSDAIAHGLVIILDETSHPWAFNLTTFGNLTDTGRKFVQIEATGTSGDLGVFTNRQIFFNEPETVDQGKTPAYLTLVPASQSGGISHGSETITVFLPDYSNSDYNLDGFIVESDNIVAGIGGIDFIFMKQENGDWEFLIPSL
jgi:hypothetical protein